MNNSENLSKEELDILKFSLYCIEDYYLDLMMIDRINGNVYLQPTEVNVDKLTSNQENMYDSYNSCVDTILYYETKYGLKSRLARELLVKVEIAKNEKY